MLSRLTLWVLHKLQFRTDIKWNPMNIEELVLQIGSLRLYELKSSTLLPKITYVWRDHRFPKEFGPFDSKFEAMDNYAWTLKTFQTLKIQPILSEPEIPNRVVKVDFKTRKRV